MLAARGPMRFRFDDAAEIVETRGWRAHLRFAMLESGETQVSLAHAIGKPQQHISRLLDETRRRALNVDWLELMRDSAPECWRFFVWFHTESARERDARARRLQTA